MGTRDFPVFSQLFQCAAFLIHRQCRCVTWKWISVFRNSAKNLEFSEERFMVHLIHLIRLEKNSPRPTYISKMLGFVYFFLSERCLGILIPSALLSQKCCETGNHFFFITWSVVQRDKTLSGRNCSTWWKSPPTPRCPIGAFCNHLCFCNNVLTESVFISPCGVSFLFHRFFFFFLTFVN